MTLERRICSPSPPFRHGPEQLEPHPRPPDYHGGTAPCPPCKRRSVRVSFRRVFHADSRVALASGTVVMQRATSDYMDIQITTKKSEGVERLLEVSVPLAAVNAEEEKTARRYATSGSPARLPARQGARRDGAQAVQGRHPPAGARDARAGGVQGSDGAREAGCRRAAARARREVRRGPAAHLRAAPRGAAEARADAHRRLPRHAHGNAGDRRCRDGADRDAARPEGDVGAGRGAAARGRHGEGAARDAGDGGRRDAGREPVQPRARRRPGDPRRGGARHGAHAGRDEGARREVAGRLPRRVAARRDEERARHARRR